MSGAVIYEVREGVSIISFNRPERHNALDDEASAELWAVFDRATADGDSRVILLRGEGKSFCSGRDTAVLGERRSGLSHFEHLTRNQDRKMRLLDSRKPTVAAVRGHAIGGGFEFALQCDLRVASTDARMSIPEITYGLLTDGAGAALIASLAGPSRAKFMLMSGQAIDAQQALAWGLVDFLTTPDDLDARAFEIAKGLAVQPPVHLAAAKYLVDGLQGERIRRSLRDELMVQMAMFRSDDYQEARAARRERRSPKFVGR